jgi:hypothetical protein
MAHLAAARTPNFSIARLWTAGETAPEGLLYVSYLIREGGRERFLKLFERQTMAQAREVYGADLDAIEQLYQSANRDLRAPESRSRLIALVDRYPKANRSGCALLYLAQASAGEEREAFLRRAIAEHSDAFYGDGTQVGAFGRVLLALHLAETDRRDEALALAADVDRLYPGAVDHSGRRLTDTLRRLGLLK